MIRIAFAILFCIAFGGSAFAQATCAGNQCQPVSGTFGTISSVAVSGSVLANNIGLVPLDPVQVATVTILPFTPTYFNGASGNGATLTGTTNGALSINNYSVVVGDRVLVKNQAQGYQNGIYLVVSTGSASTPYILSRTIDAMSNDQFFHGISTFDHTGGASWVMTTDGPIVVGSTSMVWKQYTHDGTPSSTGAFTVQSAARVATDALTITAGSKSLTTASAHFSSTDVGKIISIAGLGPSAGWMQKVQAGAGYTPGSNQVFTVTGGSCSTPIVFEAAVEAGGTVNVVDRVTTKGVCETQPANPVSATPAVGGGAGATFNISWAALSTTISSFTSVTQVTLAANASATLSAASTSFVFGSDQTSDLKSELALVTTAASTQGAASLTLCGAYIVTGTINKASMPPNVSIVGTCPNTTLYPAGNTGYFTLDLGGGGLGSATTFSAAPGTGPNYGESAVLVTDPTIFHAGDVVTYRANTTNGGIRGGSNMVTGVFGSVVQLNDPMPFTVDTTFTNSLTVVSSPAQNLYISGMEIDCSFSGSGAQGLLASYLLYPTIYLQTKNCNNSSPAESKFGLGIEVQYAYGGSLRYIDTGSGSNGNSNASTVFFSGSMWIEQQVESARGFGAIIAQSSGNYLNISVNGALGRGVKLDGAGDNRGILKGGHIPPGLIAVGLADGSEYNHFSYVEARDAPQCFWTNGLDNLNNVVDLLMTANCTTNSIVITANDTGNIIYLPNYGPGSSASTISNAASALIGGGGTLNAGTASALAQYQADGLSVGAATLAKAVAATQQGLISFTKSAIDFNSANTDNAITITLPTGFTRYAVDSVVISGASHSLSTATCGLFSATGGGGTAIVTSASAITVTATAEATLNNMQFLTVNGAQTTSYNFATLQFRVQTAEGVAATGTVTVTIRPES